MEFKLSRFEISIKTSIAEVEIVENNNEDCTFSICSTLLNSTISTIDCGFSGLLSLSVTSTSSVLAFMTVRNISVIPSITATFILLSME